ncbi:hypothetical protein DXG03_007014 [Asterophora parasitica]|uniref:Uncharacterized protein n=1 Tax=Asterophora parasitica TaxID=117018 RepID=A0A9P7GIL9_9AGAR|nr:hypothetical protein DXG03_007014 [Asterophora parasitica]
MPGILDLLDRPFGPYPEGDILSEKFHQGDLTSFSMECGHKPIGCVTLHRFKYALKLISNLEARFDETEYLISAPRSSRIAKDATEFWGVLIINDFQWLSFQGKEWLQQDLRQRDLEMNPQRTTSGLSLSTLYGSHKSEGSRLSVWVHGEKNMPAQFMTGTPPRPLVVRSGKRHSYNLRSLDVGTFHRSQNFLARYRLWALVNEIIETDPEQTPIEDRTIDWLITSYIDRFRPRDLDHHFFSPSSDTGGTKHRRRHLRHLPQAEVMGLFAAHADWLLAQQLASHHGNLKIVNIRKWMTFCEQAATVQQDAWKRGVPWGLPHGNSTNNHRELSGRLSHFENKKEFWELKINKALKKNYPALELRNNNRPSVQKIPEPKYDSDFSEASSSSFTDSSKEELAPPADFHPSVVQPPTIPLGSFEWRCPVPGCCYTIDLLSLTAENTDILPPVEVEHLKDYKSWRLMDERVQGNLQLMVQAHNDVHHPPQTRRQLPKRGILPTHLPPIKVEDVDGVVIIG